MLLLVDLDGVVYRGPEPVPGIPALLAERVAAGDTVVYCTNNSSRHRSEYVAQLEALGAPVRLDRVFSSACATAQELAASDPPVRVAMVMGARALVRELREAGVRTVPPTLRGLALDPDAVVVGIDRRLTYQRLSIAMQAIREGARFVATNRDPVFPTPEGLQPGAGSMVAALETAARRSPDLVVGKPEPTLFRAAARSVGQRAEDAIVIGDGVLTDIAAANRVGARSVLMLTGVTSRAEAEAQPPERRPTRIAAGAAELRTALREIEADGSGGGRLLPGG
ncbi:MAG: HAD-IIA family hydrolase [Candidatus Limnocylindrales bacterium]